MTRGPGRDTEYCATRERGTGDEQHKNRRLPSPVDRANTSSLRKLRVASSSDSSERPVGYCLAAEGRMRDRTAIRGSATGVRGRDYATTC